MNNKIVKVDKTGLLETRKEEDPLLFCDDYGAPDKHKKDSSETILRTSIKSKSYLSKLMQALPLPPLFNRLMMTTFFCIAIASGIAVAEYIILDSLFSNVESELQISLNQRKQVRCLCDVAVWLMQAVAVNE
ncbi:MAG: hypothetical protein P4M11_03630 [Candidatus Pacebacteria bacterium]|nr:hypothetical protein [Candidatus Paceibacterota bacterium]